MASRQARRRGKDLEKRVADLLGGQLYPGQAGDVIWGDWVIECKYRHGYRLERQDQLRHWVEQAKENVKRQGKGKWMLAVYGGKGTEYLAILPIQDLIGGGMMPTDDLLTTVLERINPAQLLPDWERIRELVAHREMVTVAEALERFGLELEKVGDLAYRLGGIIAETIPPDGEERHDRTA